MKLLKKGLSIRDRFLGRPTKQPVYCLEDGSLIEKEETIKVSVKNTFSSCRQPCPVKGTEGRIVYLRDNYARVRFELPFKCIRGYEWKLSLGHPYMELDFRLEDLNVLEDEL